MNFKLSFRSAKARFLVVVAGLVLAGALLTLGSGIRAVDLNHAVARVAFRGLDAAQQEQVRRAVTRISGYRRSAAGYVAARPADVWRAEIEFQAGSLTEATIRLLEWKSQFRPPVTVAIEKLTYQTLRLHRPGRGDLVLGTPQTLSPDQPAATPQATDQPPVPGETDAPSVPLRE